MSPRLSLQYASNGARSSRGIISNYTCPRCSLVRDLRRYSSQDASTSDESKSAKPYTKDFKKRPTKRSRTIFSLIQPTGIPHLGNYLGALRAWRDFQDEKKAPGLARRNHSLYFGLADLHSLTSKQDPAQRRDDVRKTYASLLAIGLDPELCVMFVQSQVPNHAELMWILSNVASTGYLSRMTQWKDKMGLETTDNSAEAMQKLDEKSQEKLKLSLFSYPVLQAADILLYGPDTVPVGEDQAQHVEFTRHVARSFNSTYVEKGKPPILRVPELLVSPARRVMSLQNPTKKMSKSDPDLMSRILITDTPEEIKEKFKKAKTDSIPGPITYSHVERPGVSNLIDIYKHVQRNPKNQDTIADELSDMTLGQLKAMVAEAVIRELEGVRDKYHSLIDSDNVEVDKVMIKGRSMASARAGSTMQKVWDAVGLYSPYSMRLNLRQNAKQNEKASATEVQQEPEQVQ